MHREDLLPLETWLYEAVTLGEFRPKETAGLRWETCGQRLTSPPLHMVLGWELP